MRIRALFAVLCLIVFSSCSLRSSQEIVQPNLERPYVLVTAQPGPSKTPFRPIGASPVPPTPEPSWTPLPTLPPSATDTPFPTYTPIVAATTAAPTEIVGAKIIEYNINMYWDYDGHTVSVSQETVYPNQTGVALTELVMVVNPNLWSGVFLMGTLNLNGLPDENFSLSGQWLTIPLATPLEPGQAIRVGLSYTLTLPYSSAKYENFGWNERQANLIDWYPFFPAYFPGEGWVIRDPWAFGENLAYPIANIYVGLRFASAARPVVAASALPIEDKDGMFRYAFLNARSFTLSVSPEYEVASDSFGNITILSYYFPEHEMAGQALLENTRKAVETYTNAFGPYPHTALSAVETRLNDGLEADGLYFLSGNFYSAYDGSATNNLVLIGIHETAHQWWYAAVANDQATEPWLDEGLATYSERIFYETNYPELLSWWYNARIYYYNPSGYIDMRLYDSAIFRTYVDAVYLRGALFLDNLRSNLGDEAFFNFMRDYYARHRGHFATTDTFFTVLSEYGNSYQPLVEEYFYNR